MLLYQRLKFRKSLGGHHPITRGGGCSFCRGQMIYFNQARQRAETCIKIVLHVDKEQFST